MRLSIFLPLLLSLVACASPMTKLKPKIAAFLEKNPDHLQSYQSPNRKMQYAWSGNPEKQAIVFVHGSPGGWGAWVDFLSNEKLQKNFHLIAVDRPGYGGSDSGNTEPSLKKQAVDILSVLQVNRSGRPAIFVAHSYGGAVIAQIGADASDKVDALIFVASSVDPAQEHEKWFQYPASWWPISKIIPTALRVCNEEILALKGELELLQPRWSEIKASIATIQGTEDDLVPLANQDYILARVSSAQIKYKQRVPGMNHFVPWEHPELIYEAIETVTARK